MTGLPLRLGSIREAGRGGGSLSGPDAAVDGNFAAFDGTDGKKVKDSGKTAADFAAAVHTHPASQISDASANGRSLITAADYPAMRVLLSLVKGTAAGNIPVLDGSGKLDTAILPSLAITDTFVVSSQAAMLALTAQTGDVAIRTDLNKTFILSTNSPTTLADWKEMLTPTDAVLSVAGLTGAISASALKTALAITAADITNASANGRSLITAADYAAMRTLLGLVIGTNVQAQSAKLQNIAGLAPATGDTIVWNGTAYVSQAGSGPVIVDTQTFNSTGTWNKPAGMLDTDLAIVDYWGAGGSGGVQASNAAASTGGPGGGGGHNRREFRGYELNSSEPVIVGAGGLSVSSSANAANAVGNAGGYSEFKGFRAYGGGPGGVQPNAQGTGGGTLEGGKTGSSGTGRGGGPTELGPAASASAYSANAGVGALFYLPGEWGGGFTSTSAADIVTPVHGGGAGNATQATRGSIWGGGAGGYYNADPNHQLGGLSTFGGKGGDCPAVAGNTSNVNGGNGVAPGGGGSAAKWGTTGTATSGAGANGRITITVIRGI